MVKRHDKSIVITQLPKASGFSKTENLVQADKPIIEYRKQRKELQEENAKGLLPDKMI